MDIFGTTEHYSYELAFTAKSKVLLNGGNGVITFGPNFGNSTEWAVPALRTTGSVSLGGRTYNIDPARSLTWYDRQAGFTAPSNWTWFQLHFPGSNIKASIWAFDLEAPASPSTNRFATVRVGEESQYVLAYDLKADWKNTWTSKKTNVTYPQSWRLEFENGDALNIESVRRDQEIYGPNAVGDSVYAGFINAKGLFLGQRVGNWEGFGNYPYLASQINKETILGYQKSVITIVKHLNSKVLNGLLKTELAFQGFVVSNWDEQGPNHGNLTNTVKNGTVTQSRLNDMVIRALTAWLKYGDFRGIGEGIPTNATVSHKFVNERDPLARPAIFQGAVERQVLVKNVNKTMPLSKAKNSPDNIFFSLYTFGLEAAGNYLNGSSFIPNKLFDLSDIGIRTMEKAPEIALNGTLITGGGSGSTTPAFIEALLDAI
ncbi:hypothetical protein FSOLCH5_015318 [Fusarium solani]